jgi:hypothetical protein
MLYRRLRLHFIGTSNQTASQAPARVMPEAMALGVVDCVTEIAPRIDYLDALTALTQATALLLIGSSEPHYTPSRLYPALWAKRPLLAILHAESSAVEILRRATPSPAARIVACDGHCLAQSRVETIFTELRELVRNPVYDAAAVDMAAVGEYCAESLAGKLAAVFSHASTGRGSDGRADRRERRDLCAS